MATELAKATGVALLAWWGGANAYRAVFFAQEKAQANGGQSAWMKATDIDAGEFFPVLFTVAMIAGILT